jgi:hypothetical protein
MVGEMYVSMFGEILKDLGFLFEVGWWVGG